ncbi:11184_t:CDS:2, partial [Cetraspora pellucida]
ICVCDVLYDDVLCDKDIFHGVLYDKDDIHGVLYDKDDIYGVLYDVLYDKAREYVCNHVHRVLHYDQARESWNCQCNGSEKDQKYESQVELHDLLIKKNFLKFEINRE